MLYFRYPLGIHGWKLKPKTEPDKFRVSEPETVGEKSNMNPKPLDPKPADIRPEPAPAAIFNEVHQEAQAEARVPSDLTSPPSSWTASVAHGPVVSRVFAIRHSRWTIHTGAV
jgi:hypothetical protein